MQSSDGAIPLFWGIAADGSVVISDEKEVIKGGCGKSFAPFPAGMYVCMHIFVRFLFDCICKSYAMCN